MYSKYQLATRWFQYYIYASNSKGHGMHSPFVYELIREVMNDDRDYYAYKLVETVKKQLLLDERQIKITDFGAGASESFITRPVSAIAKRSLSDQKFGRLLFRMANFYRAKNILEMGSSLGISTAYLASADSLSRVTTLEGDPAIASIAAETFEKLKLNNIVQVTGHFDDKLPGVMETRPAADLVFIDGNHRKKPVLNYVEQILDKISFPSILIIHDIHWSREMEETWKLIQQHPSVKMSIDIFSAGLIFLRNEFQVKQAFAIRF